MLNTPLLSCPSLVVLAQLQQISVFASKWDQSYGRVMAWLRCRLFFSLLRSSIMCIRGACSSCCPTMPTDLISSEALWPTNCICLFVHFLLLYLFICSLQSSCQFHLYTLRTVVFTLLSGGIMRKYPSLGRPW